MNSELAIDAQPPAVAHPAPLRIGPMHPDTIAKVYELEDELIKHPQGVYFTDHLIHKGMYLRTVMVPAGHVVTGALVKIATALIVSGEGIVYLDEGATPIRGYNVVPAAAGRKQAFVAYTDMWLTMVFPTEARTVEEAEREFTDEYERLASHRDPDTNRVTVTEDL